MLNWQYSNGKLLLGGVEVEPTSVRTIEEMKPVLQEPEKTKPGDAYFVYRDVEDSDKPEGTQADITVLPSAMWGEEYAKTFGHYHLGEGVEIYKVLSGNGVVIMQQPGFNFETVEAVRMVKLPPGQEVEIPSGWGHNLINLGRTPLITVNYQKPGLENFYAAYAKKKGAAYIICACDQEFSIHPNSTYGEVPKLQTF